LVNTRGLGSLAIRASSCSAGQTLDSNEGGGKELISQY